MVEKHDINSLLQTGSWRTSRSRSPSLYDSHRPAYESPKPNIGVPRTVELVSRSKRPPPPCVEDEEESLAKEHTGSVVSLVSETSDEEPKCRGEIDQQPLLLPVHEHNPERRFVLVPGAAPEDAPKTTQARYEANTCRKYVLVDSEKGAEKTETAKEEKKRDTSPSQKPDRPTERPNISKRKSHQDLPRLKTDVEDAKPPIRRSGSRRDRERPVVHQETLDSNVSRDSSSTRPPDSAFLSPDAVKHTARRRDRAYSDVRSDASGRSGRSPSMRRDAEVEVSDRKRPHHSSKYAPTPSLHRRASSTANVPTRSSPPPRERIRDGPPAERPKSFMQSYGYGDPEDVFAYMAPGIDFMTGRPGRDVSPPRRMLDEQSARHPRGAREMPGPSPNRRRQPRAAARDRDRDGYSSDDSYKEKRSGERPYPRRSTLEPEEHFSPDPPRRASTRPLPAGPSLLVTQPTQISPDLVQSNGRSATFPFDKSKPGTEHSVSPARDNSSSPSRRPTRNTKGAQPSSHSRDASIGSVSNGSGSLPPSVPGSRGRTSGMEREPTGQVVNLLRQESSDPQSPTFYWQPSQPNQPGEEGDARAAATSTALAQLPDCRWKHPSPARSSARSGQFLTMKRAENFTICPDCYGAVFANTEFQHLFVPAPVRSGDQLISCDFGASPWYRIAYIMTIKHEYPDLRLLQAIASVAARSQACAGGQLATRIWYSMMAPASRRPIQSFNVCLNCAKMVEALLPNLAGVFVPLDSHEPTRGICELHFSPERKRFFDYFEEMKSTSEHALSRRTAPDLLQLVDRVRDISLHEECLRNTPIPNRKWHVLQQVPEFTVCEDCFNEVVWPLIEVDELGTEIPRNFYKNKQPRPVASCQLYSERMRREFGIACRFDDFNHLAATVLHRMRVLGDIKLRFNELQRADQGDPAVQEELAALTRKFKEVE